MSDKKKNFATAALVVALLVAALTVRFSPRMNFRDILHSLVELPQNVFSFIWNQESEEVPQEESPRKEETPLVLFGEENVPIIPKEPSTSAPPSINNELPMDAFTDEGEPAA